MDVSQEPNAFEPLLNHIPTPAPVNEPEPKKERDDVYYFDTIVFEVENTLFRVPKKGFQVADSFFETTFSLPQPEGKMVEGSDDSCPLPLRGISKAHFRGFLRILYPFNETTITYEEWVGALDLATMWDFKEIRKASVRALSNIITSRDVVENILLAKKYRVKHWLRDGYLKLIQQNEPLKIDELRSLNIDLLTIARICSIRETLWQPSWSCDNCGLKHERRYVGRADTEITQIFADEMKEMEDFEPVVGLKKRSRRW